MIYHHDLDDHQYCHDYQYYHDDICFAGDLLHLAVKYHLPALTKHLELILARWNNCQP